MWLFLCSLVNMLGRVMLLDMLSKSYSSVKKTRTAHSCCKVKPCVFGKWKHWNVSYGFWSAR